MFHVGFILASSNLQGDYKALDREENPLILFALLKDWIQSLEGGLIPEQEYPRIMELTKTGSDDDIYTYVLSMESTARCSLLYLIRFIWNCSLFRKSVTGDFSDLPTALSCAYLISPKQSLFYMHFNCELLVKFVQALLHAVGSRQREAFLPDDPTAREMEQFKVLLYSGIPPVCGELIGYTYSLENLHRLETVAREMFHFGLLPETNTYGCSVHRLPKPPKTKLPLFLPIESIYVKHATTRMYRLGKFWLSPFLDSAMFSIGDENVVAIPLASITVQCVE